LLPESDIPVRLVDNDAHLDFLGAQDDPWLRLLIAEFERFEGRSRRQLSEALAGPMSRPAPQWKRRAAARILFRLWDREQPKGIHPSLLREVLFRCAAQSKAERARVREETAFVLQIPPEQLSRWLFCDLPSERLMQRPTQVTTPQMLRQETNLAIAQATLMRAASVTIDLVGNARAIVRLARLRGLLCSVVANPNQGPPTLSLSGPYALFRHTVLYGKALAEILPHLAWCNRYELRAQCRLQGRFRDVFLDQDSPIAPAKEPKPFDSKLEQRLADELQPHATEWHVIREPEPLTAGTHLIFPDFLLQHRLHPERRVLVELAGFWTPEYLSQKFARLAEANAPNLIVCVDAERACGVQAAHESLRLLPYRGYVDAKALMARVEGLNG
jgi:uncharacterized protein